METTGGKGSRGQRRKRGRRRGACARACAHAYRCVRGRRRGSVSTCRGEMRSNKENERRPGRGRKGRGEVGGTAERLEGRPHRVGGSDQSCNATRIE